MMADVLRAPHQNRDLVFCRHHAAIDADIHHAAVGILRHHAAVSKNVAAAVDAIPLRHRKLVEIDVLALDDVFLDRPGLDDFRRNRFVQDRAAELHQLARMGVRLKPKHHGDATRTRKPAGEDLMATAVRAVIADVAEEQRRPGAGTLRQARDGAKFDVPIDLGLDVVKFAGSVERFHPAAQIAECNRLSFRGHEYGQWSMRLERFCAAGPYRVNFRRAGARKAKNKAHPMGQAAEPALCR